MASPHLTIHTPLRRRIEQVLAATPGGLDWRTLADELARRAVAAQRPIPDRAEVVRALGGLIVEGRVDERAGRFVLRTVSDGWGRAAA
ncbi:MAG: hypothetical protein H6531_10015 [Actinobacteria bacterium]|nr:hypothetical protein [Thermoleophilia bacterium]MCB9012150.1 hypothetical protein [Actinomycetota bacterium]